MFWWNVISEFLILRFDRFITKVVFFFIFLFFLQYELIYQVLGRSNFNKITANLDLFLRRFNEVQYWVVTEMVLAQNVGKRVQLLRKFIKVAAQYVHFSHYCICIQELRVLYKKSTTQDKLINEVYIVKRNVWHLFLFISSCKEFQNLHSFFAIVMGLSNIAVSRLSQTWEVTGKIFPNTPKNDI